MEKLNLRDTVLYYISNADEELLKIIKSVMESYSENDTVAFHPDGRPMTRNFYKSALNKAESQVNEGDYVSAEDFLKEE